MWYYNIRIFPASHDMITKVSEFGEFRYNNIPIGMCAPGDISQAKVENLIGYIEGVKTYISTIY